MAEFRQTEASVTRPVYSPSADFMSVLTTKALQYGVPAPSETTATRSAG